MFTWGMVPPGSVGRSDRWDRSVVGSVGDRPAIGDGAQGRGVDGVVLVPTLASGDDQPGRLEHVEVLRDRLAGRRQVVLRRQPGAELEEGLVVTLDQLVEDRPSGGI